MLCFNVGIYQKNTPSICYCDFNIYDNRTLRNLNLQGPVLIMDPTALRNILSKQVPVGRLFDFLLWVNSSLALLIRHWTQWEFFDQVLKLHPEKPILHNLCSAYG